MVKILTDNNTVISPDKQKLKITGGLEIINGDGNVTVINNQGLISVERIDGLSLEFTKFAEEGRYIHYDVPDPEDPDNNSLIIDGGHSKGHDSI